MISVSFKGNKNNKLLINLKKYIYKNKLLSDLILGNYYE